MEEAAKKMEGAAADPTILSSKKTPLGTGPWYRHRNLVYAMLACNVTMVSYLVLNQDRRKPLKKEEQGSSVTTDKEKMEPVVVPAPQTQLDQAKSSSVAKAEEEDSATVTAAAAAIKQQVPHVSPDEQIEIYKWMLEEKRKMKPSSREEKARIDTEKRVLKDHIRGKTFV